MANSHNLVARPYAKAAFEFALAARDLVAWQDFLRVSAVLVNESNFHRWLFDPRVTKEKILEVMFSVCKEWLNKSRENFLRLLQANNRLQFLPEIVQLFNVHKAQYDKTVDVTVLTYAAFTPEQVTALSAALEKRLQRKVVPHFKIDTSLLGGAIVCADNLVIDGSVRTRLKRLKYNLAFE